MKTSCWALGNRRLDSPPYWSFTDLGIFFLLLASLHAVLLLLVLFHLLPSSTLATPSISVQTALVGFLSVGLYSILKLRHRRPVLKPLGWVMPQKIYVVAAVVCGPFLAALAALYPRLSHQPVVLLPNFKLLALAVVLAPMLEESLFRGCLLPTIAEMTGVVPAIVITAFLFALFHGPTNVAGGLFLTATGLAYGWLRVTSRSTTAPALMHAAYNLSLFCWLH